MQPATEWPARQPVSVKALLIMDLPHCRKCMAGLLLQGLVPLRPVPHMTVIANDTSKFKGTSTMSIIANVKDRITKKMQYRQIVSELSALSPRELDDLGLNYYGVRETARRAVYGSDNR